jgi:RimJ/RimL family protein N-acetyltransferase
MTHDETAMLETARLILLRQYWRILKRSIRGAVVLRTRVICHSGQNTEEQTKSWLVNAKPGFDFAVVLKNTGNVIGSGGIYPDDKKYSGELGWILHRDYWKQGYGTEFGAELIRYGFKDLKLERIFAPCAAVNYGSYRVMERNGMKREGLFRKAWWSRKDNEWLDQAWYAILAEEYL